MRKSGLSYSHVLGDFVDRYWRYALAVALIGGMLKIEILMIDSGRARYFYFFTATLGICWTLLLVLQKVARLRYLRGDDLASEKAKMKLHSEIFAALALVTFLGLYFRAGYEGDVSNERARFKYLSQATEHMAKVINAEECEHTNAAFSCKRAEKIFEELSASVGSAKELDVYRKLDSLRPELLEVSRRSSHQNQVEIELVLGNLDDAVMDERALLVVLQALQLFAMVFGMLAISRKVALAWFERQQASLRKHEKSQPG